MGNLRQKYTDAEWDAMERQDELDRKNGKPDDFGHIAVFINRWSVEDMDRLRNLIEEIEGKNTPAVWNITKWIKWKQFKANSK